MVTLFLVRSSLKRHPSMKRFSRCSLLRQLVMTFLALVAMVMLKCIYYPVVYQLMVSLAFGGSCFNWLPQC